MKYTQIISSPQKTICREAVSDVHFFAIFHGLLNIKNCERHRDRQEYFDICKLFSWTHPSTKTKHKFSWISFRSASARFEKSLRPEFRWFLVNFWIMRKQPKFVLWWSISNCRKGTGRFSRTRYSAVLLHPAGLGICQTYQVAREHEESLKR